MLRQQKRRLVMVKRISHLRINTKHELMINGGNCFTLQVMQYIVLEQSLKIPLRLLENKMLLLRDLFPTSFEILSRNML